MDGLAFHALHSDLVEAGALKRPMGSFILELHVSNTGSNVWFSEETAAPFVNQVGPIAPASGLDDQGNVSLGYSRRIDVEPDLTHATPPFGGDIDPAVR
jgi:hypothetical protein